MAKVLLLFRLAVGVGDIGEYAYVQYMEVTNPLSQVDKVLVCVCLRWATEDGVDRTLNIEASLQRNRVEAGEWYGLVPFSSIMSTVHILRSNIAIPPFSPQLPWPLHRFYINRFYIQKGLEVQADLEVTDPPEEGSCQHETAN